MIMGSTLKVTIAMNVIVEDGLKDTIDTQTVAGTLGDHHTWMRVLQQEVTSGI